MLIKSLVKTKDQLTTLHEDVTLEQALNILEESDFRCVPVLDQSSQIFRGNIYKMHIYRHKSRGGDMQLPVTTLLKNSTKFISVNAAFFNVFFSIRDLPYIAVLDEQSKFYGILTHTKLLNMLAEGWNVHAGSYVLTVTTPDERGSLVTMAKAITKFSPIANCISLDLQEPNVMRRILFTLPANVDEAKLKKIVKSLKRKGFDVPEIEDLHSTL
ncbi:cyclic di-AMP binding protein CbpA [Paucilactobacillus sp. N302-9]